MVDMVIRDGKTDHERSLKQLIYSNESYEPEYVNCECGLKLLSSSLKEHLTSKEVDIKFIMSACRDGM